MKHKTIIYITIAFLACFSLATKANNYGLRMKSHDFTGKDKTSLLLLGGKPINIGQKTSVSFKFDLRSAPIFGNILTVLFDNGQEVEFCITPDESMKTYKPTLIINDRIYPIDYTLRAFDPLQRIEAKFVINKSNNQITIGFGDKQRTISQDLSSISEAKFNFGKQMFASKSLDIAPIDLYDIDVRRNSKPLYYWALRTHSDSISYDSISHAPAVATCAIWIRDDHTRWQPAFSYRSNTELQYVFSQKQNQLYIFDDDSLTIWNLATKQRTSQAINSGYRVMRYSKYLYFNEQEQKIYNYNLQRKTITSFDLANSKWDNTEQIKDEPAYLNHTQASNGSDVFYTFGGYGFYRYSNKLFRIDLSNNKIEELHYSPQLKPRTSSASSIVGNKLYIFGGMGNEAGKQELPQEAYADLWEIDLQTLKAHKLWETKLDQKLVCTSQMIYNSKEQCFYVATTNKQIMRVPLAQPKLDMIGEAIPVEMNFDILNYSLYESKQLGKLLAIVDRSINGKEHVEHVLEVFTIDLPILPVETGKKSSTGNTGYTKWIAAIAILLLIILASLMIKRRHGASRLGKQHNQPNEPDTSADTNVPTEDNTVLPQVQTANQHHYYDKSMAEIRMLGEFLVYDKKGNDITSKFTPRTRNLLMMLFLHSAIKDKGIEIRQLDEALWANMSDEAARNNRNVYMRKLRVLLEEVGDIEISNDKINYKVAVGNGTLFDFDEANKLMTAIDKGDDNDEIQARTMELLLRGSLLPNLSKDWLDDIKANYSNRALTLLHKLARRAFINGNYDKAYHIADAIMVHDPFSEEALAMQCQILCKRKTVGIAKILYDKFCKTYEQAIGEPYAKAFADVCKSAE